MNDIAASDKALCSLTAVEAMRPMEEGTLTVTDYVAALVSRIESRDSRLKAFVYFDKARILEDSRRHDAGPAERRGPLYGLPIGVKDIILTRDMPTQYNSRIFTSEVPRNVDAACIKTIRHAGAIMFGKLSTTEFATTKQGGWHQNHTRNAHSESHTPGGSSSGSAAAVAAGMVPIAIGTQTGGSIIRPASYNGCFGWKPTWNAISREGIAQWCITFDTVGFFSRCVEDLELMADVYHLTKQPAAASVELRDAKIAFCFTPNKDKASSAVRRAMHLTKDRVTELGAMTSDIDLPDEFSHAWRWHETITRSEGRSSFLSQYVDQPELLHESIRGYVEGEVSPKDILEAYDGLASLRPVFDQIASRYDAIITPSVPDEAPLGLESTGDMSFCLLWTALHVPVLNIPCYQGDNGLPLGLTVVGPRLKDRQVLAAGKAIFAALTNKSKTDIV